MRNRRRTPTAALIARIARLLLTALAAVAVVIVRDGRVLPDSHESDLGHRAPAGSSRSGDGF
jgi:hypothetical protein